MCYSNTGYCFNFDLYAGKKTTESTISGLEVVLNMIAKVNVPSDHIFYFDNFFTSFDLMKVLTERSISASGTVRINRTNKCPLSTDDNLKKQDRGFYDYRMDSKSDIYAVVWKVYFYFYFFYLYIYPPDSQESDGGAIHRVSNYPDLLPEMPRYCCPLVI